MPDYVTDGEMSRWMTEQQDFRHRLEHRLGAQHAEIVDRLERIEEQVRETNGRTRKAEANIAIEDREIEAVKTALARLTQQVGVGLGAPCWPTLTSRQKAAAGTGLLVVIMPAIIEVVKGGIAFAQWAGGMR